MIIREKDLFNPSKDNFIKLGLDLYEIVESFGRDETVVEVL